MQSEIFIDIRLWDEITHESCDWNERKYWLGKCLNAFDSEKTREIYNGNGFKGIQRKQDGVIQNEETLRMINKRRNFCKAISKKAENRIWLLLWSNRDRKIAEIEV